MPSSSSRARIRAGDRSLNSSERNTASTPSCSASLSACAGVGRGAGEPCRGGVGFRRRYNVASDVPNSRQAVLVEVTFS